MLTLLVLIVDLYGNSATGVPFWTHGLCPKERKRTTYVANCKLSQRKRKELQKKFAKGEGVCLGDVLRLQRQGSASTIGLNVSQGSLGGETAYDGEEGGVRDSRVERRGGDGGVRDAEWMGGAY